VLCPKSNHLYGPNRRKEEKEGNRKERRKEEGKRKIGDGGWEGGLIWF
jgi:hypothetical protein